MASKVKNYSGVYSMLNKTTAKYFSHTPMMWVGRFADELAEGYEKFKDYPGFPGPFYTALSDALVMWCMCRFRGCDGVKGIQTALNKVWKMHKPYLEKDVLSGDDLETAMTVANKLASDASESAMRDFCAAVLMDVRDAVEKQDMGQIDGSGEDVNSKQSEETNGSNDADTNTEQKTA